MKLLARSPLAAAALVAFAANSVLCRLALAERRIDAQSFTAIRLSSGALVLGLLSFARLRSKPWPGSVSSTLALLLYAVPFSLAYLRLQAGMGALILFASVQATMIGAGLIQGERVPARAWLGLLLAFAGLVGLTLPGSSAPDPVGAALMVTAGAAWGVYTLRGRKASAAALETTAANFIGTLPAALLLACVETSTDRAATTLAGVVLAVASGALASGVGYTLWYSALGRLRATTAAILQLLVPVLAAVGGVVFLGEALSARLVLAGASVLAGVAIFLTAGKAKPAPGGEKGRS